MRKLLPCFMRARDAKSRHLRLTPGSNLGSLLSARSGFAIRCRPNETFRCAWSKRGQGRGRMMPVIVFVHVWLTGNLEHVIRGVVLLSSACVSGTEAGAAIGLHGEDNAALESVCVSMWEKGEEQEESYTVCFFFRLVFQQVKACITGCSHYSQTCVCVNLYCTFLEGTDS